MCVAYPTFCIVVLTEFIVLLVRYMREHRSVWELTWYIFGGGIVIVAVLVYGICLGFDQIYLFNPNAQFGTQLTTSIFDGILKGLKAIKGPITLLVEVELILTVLLSICVWLVGRKKESVIYK